MMLPGNDMKLPIIVADDSTFVMRLQELPTPGVQPVPIVPPGPGGLRSSTWGFINYKDFVYKWISLLSRFSTSPSGFILANRSVLLVIQTYLAKDTVTHCDLVWELDFFWEVANREPNRS